mmetsp:Transcript_49000/g.107073  ORF Transcript_49000/g.107073 Transcript_49000/m.107073 type:complete len:210 (-) Transcript_49000:60-689(-)
MRRHRLVPARQRQRPAQARTWSRLLRPHWSGMASASRPTTSSQAVSLGILSRLRAAKLASAALPDSMCERSWRRTWACSPGSPCRPSTPPRTPMGRRSASATIAVCPSAASAAVAMQGRVPSPTPSARHRSCCATCRSRRTAACRRMRRRSGRSVRNSTSAGKWSVFPATWAPWANWVASLSPEAWSVWSTTRVPTRCIWPQLWSRRRR